MLVESAEDAAADPRRSRLLLTRILSLEYSLKLPGWMEALLAPKTSLDMHTGVCTATVCTTGFPSALCPRRATGREPVAEGMDQDAHILTVSSLPVAVSVRGRLQRTLTVH